MTKKQEHLNGIRGSIKMEEVALSAVRDRLYRETVEKKVSRNKKNTKV